MASRDQASPALAAKSAEKDGNTTLIDVFNPIKTKEMYNIKPHPETGRLIDAYPVRRNKPMRVLCLGQSRTGTMALFTALQRLGYKPYHMAVAMGSPKTNLGLWCEALRAKFHGKGPKWGRAEFDKLLGDYDAVADVPAICFAEELLEAYPEAKVVASTRDVDSWLRSMDSTGGRVLRWPLWETLADWDPALAGPFWEHAQLVMPINFRTMGDFSPGSPARQAFIDHYQLLEKAVPEGRMLTWRVQEGWKPLCEFLGEDVPEGEFPRLNDAQQFIFVHGIMWWLAFAKMVGKIALVPGAVGLGAFLVIRYK